MKNSPAALPAALPAGLSRQSLASDVAVMALLGSTVEVEQVPLYREDGVTPVYREDGVTPIYITRRVQS